MAQYRDVAVALGSNLADREAHLRYAVTCLAGVLSRLVVADFIETEPADGATGPWFLNGAAVGQSPATPEALLESLLRIEAARGRTRPFASAPRTLDLDLILVGDLVRDTHRLQLPHPRFRERVFVLRPLVTIAPQLRDPVSGRTMRELLDACEHQS